MDAETRVYMTMLEITTPTPRYWIASLANVPEHVAHVELMKGELTGIYRKHPFEMYSRIFN